MARTGSPSFSYGKQGRRYRYYISQALQQGRRPAASDVIRINADAVERFLVTTLSRLASRSLVVDDLRGIVARLELRSDETHLIIDGAELMPERHAATTIEAIARSAIPGEVIVPDDASDGALRIILPARLELRGGRVWIGGRSLWMRTQPTSVSSGRCGHLITSSWRWTPRR